MEKSQVAEKALAAAQQIKKASNILIAVHVRPDGDCLSSACAFSLWLDSLGKTHSLFCADIISDHYHFLPKASKFQTQIDIEKFDTIVIIDCACLSRTGLEKELNSARGRKKIIEIDHHPKIENVSDIEIRLPEKSSAAEVLFLFFKENKITLNKNIADCLLAGLMADTGNLLFSSVNEETIKTSSALILEGATVPKAIKNNCKNKDLAGLKVWGKIMENIRYNKEYELVYSILSLADVQSIRDEFGDAEASFDSAADLLNNADGVKASLFLREEKAGKIKGSLRSKYPGIDVSKLAEKLGGGGHKQSAAFRLDGHIIKDGKDWKIC